MKRCSLIFISLLILFCCVSCRFNPYMPDSVKIEGKEYKRAFIGELYPMDDFAPDSDGVKVFGNSYYKYSKTPYDCYIAYDRNAEPNLYFESEKFDEATSYYKDPSNFNFFCLLGNIHDENEQQIFHIENINSSMFHSLLAFSNENDYNPFTSFNKEDGLKSIPIANPDNWTADEIHFYKQSKDGAFTTSKAHTFVFYKSRLYFLYHYDFSNEDAPIMKVREVPAELNEYFSSLLHQ